MGMMVLWMGVAWGQEPSPPASGGWTATPVEAPVEPSSGTDEAILRQGEIVLDDRRPATERIAAAQALGASGDERALPYLRVAALAPVPSLQEVALAESVKFATAETLAIAQAVADSDLYTMPVRLLAVDVFGQIVRPEAGELAWDFARTSSYPAAVRLRARTVLTEHYPDIIASRALPPGVADPAGTVVMAASSGLAAGVFLSSVGVWGQLDSGDSGATVGGIGGALIGVGTGTIYSLKRPIERGEAFAYGSGMGLGLIASFLASDAMSADPSQAAVLRVVGTSAGVAGGAASFPFHPTPIGVCELDVAAWLGAGIASGAASLAGPEAPSSSISGAALGGLGLGVGAGIALSPSWRLSDSDLLFGSVIGAEAAWIGGWSPVLAEVPFDDVRGNVSFPFHLGFAGALAFAEAVPVRSGSSLLGAYGAMAGNLLGGGIPLLADAEPMASVGVMLPVGVAGTTLGLVGEPWLGLEPNDAAVIALAVPLTFAQAGAVGLVLHDSGVLPESRQLTGLVLTASGAGMVGSALLGKYTDPDPISMIILGTGAGWGTWYGVLTPYAFGLEGSPTSAITVATLSGDLGLALTGLLLSPGIGVAPGAFVLPELGGLTGATFGALGVAMVTPDGPEVAGGAVVGSVVGWGVGAIVGPHIVWPDWMQKKLRPHVSGTVIPHVGPQQMEDGSMGLGIGVTVIERRDG
jgi:hypothetical protein